MVEAAPAHTVQNPTETAYARSDLFERRHPARCTTGRRLPSQRTAAPGAFKSQGPSLSAYAKRAGSPRYG